LQNFDIQNILVAVDFSKFSRIVFNQAVTLAKKLKVKLHVIYVVEDFVTVAWPEFYTNSFRYNPPDKDEMLEKLKAFYKVKDLENIEFSVKFGEIDKNVIKAADSLESALIVVGAHGKSAFSRFVLGSQAEKIALTAKQPVWVHRGARIRHFKYMLLPIDLSEVSQKVVDLFKSAGKKYSFVLNYIYTRIEPLPVLDYVTYVSALKIYKSATQEIAKSFRARNPGLKLKVVPGEAVEEIVSRAKNYDLVIMCPHNKSGILNTFGRVTAKVIRLSPVPVLIVKP
jgi:nucleotide-binding universal stress UspA family protein